MSIIKADIVQAHARAANDTGSPEVQIALLTACINDLTWEPSNRSARDAPAIARSLGNDMANGLSSPAPQLPRSNT